MYVITLFYLDCPYFFFGSTNNLSFCLIQHLTLNVFNTFRFIFYIYIYFIAIKYYLDVGVDDQFSLFLGTLNIQCSILNVFHFSF